MAFPKSTLNEMSLSSILMNYKCLRVIDGSDTRIQVLPPKFGRLKHLRLLNLSNSEIRTLPNSICKIWNLQVLILNDCKNLIGFPKKMKSLKNLRHLLFEDCDSLRKMPSTIRELTSLRTMSEFIVGHKKGHRLEELECLNLGGKLTIRHLERVENPDDAKKANLIEKSNLHDVSFFWEGGSAPNLREDSDEKVFEALQLHSNIESLQITGFKGRHFPNWMLSSTLPKLVRIRLRHCPFLLNLSHLEELPHLKALFLEDVNIEYFGRGGNAPNTCFPALKDLELCDLSNLKGFFKEEAGRETCPNLQKLRVLNCPSLVLPPLNNLNVLECDSLLTLTSFPKLDSLRELAVWICKDLVCIPCDLAQRFPNINQLQIIDAHEDSVLINGLQGLNFLRQLAIQKSGTVAHSTCLPKGCLHPNSSLKEILILGCSDIVDIPEEIKHLSSLKTICLAELPKMVCIPNAIRHVCSLKKLFLWDLPNLTALPEWLGDLTSLCYLSIGICPKLASLPDSIKTMTNLRHFYVLECPNIKRRCEIGRGEDWHKIAHIPSVYFE